MCKKILIVDDDADFRFMLARKIKSDFNLDVEFAENVKEALVLIDNVEYSCVITDISLPIKSGHHIVRYVLNRNIPVIVVTGYSPNMMYIDRRVQAYFQKPINWDNFELTIKELCKIQDRKQEELEHT